MKFVPVLVPQKPKAAVPPAGIAVFHDTGFTVIVLPEMVCTPFQICENVDWLRLMTTVQVEIPVALLGLQGGSVRRS